MTAARMARAGRGRFLIGLGILILTIGFVAIFHSSQQQLDQMRQMELRCEQQQSSLTNQIGTMEQAIKAERQAQEHYKRNLEREAREQTELKEKTVSETNQKYASLQQHYKLLQSQHNDLNEEFTKSKSKQAIDMKSLQEKLKMFQTKLDAAHKEKEEWKQKHDQLKLNLTAKINEIEAYQQHTGWRPPVNGSPLLPTAASRNPSDVNFNAQVPVSDNLYKIQVKHADGHLSDPINRLTQTGYGDSHTTNANNKPIDRTNHTKKSPHNGIINSVENFQLIPKSLSYDTQRLTASSAASLLKKTSESSNEQENVGPNAPLPDKKSSSTASSRKIDENGGNHKSVPDGVVPIQSSFDEVIGKPAEKSENQNENNRYLNVVDEVANKHDADETVAALKSRLGDVNNVNDNENGAKEVNDSNDFVVDERSHKDHMHESTGQRNSIKNAAEEDMNLYDNKINLLKQANLGAELEAPDNHANDDLEVVHQDDGKNAHKLMNEIDGDQGKVAYPELEEQVEDEDDDDYANPVARKRDPAVRNRR